MQIARPDSPVQTVLPPVLAFLKQPRMQIGADACAAASGQTFLVHNPAMGEVLAQIPAGGAEDVDRAVKAAQAAFEGPWSQMLAVQRQNLMLKLADLIEANGEELAQLETLNQGKSVMLSRLIEVQSSAEYMRYMAGWATKIEGQTLALSIAIPPGTRYHGFTRKEPVGVVRAITPWNFPLNMAVWKLAPALAAGCTIVLKPAEETSLTTLHLAQLCLEAGIPEGVVNDMTGDDAAAGAALVAHPGVAKITFTGSTETGKLIGTCAMQDMKRVTLELGGKAPMVMFNDMDLSLLGAAAAIGSFFNSGQTCCSGARIYAQRGIYDQVLETITSVARSLPVGSGLDPANQINPMVSARHQRHVTTCIRKGIDEGATPVIGTTAPDKGFFVAPELFTDMRQDMTIMQDEIFGPVVTLTPFNDPDDAIRMANDTRYGLGASVWTQDLNKMMRYVPRIQAGKVWVNSHNIPDQNLPFGGVKQSVIGREHGRRALDNYLETRSVCVAWR